MRLQHRIKGSIMGCKVDAMKPNKVSANNIFILITMYAMVKIFYKNMWVIFQTEIGTAKCFWRFTSLQCTVLLEFSYSVHLGIVIFKGYLLLRQV